MLDQEGAKCDEWQLNLVASLLVGRESLPLSSSKRRLQWKRHESANRGQGSASSTLLRGFLLGIKSEPTFVGWGGVCLHLRGCGGISRHMCGSNIRRLWQLPNFSVEAGHFEFLPLASSLALFTQTCRSLPVAGAAESAESKPGSTREHGCNLLEGDQQNRGGGFFLPHSLSFPLLILCFQTKEAEFLRQALQSLETLACSIVCQCYRYAASTAT